MLRDTAVARVKQMLGFKENLDAEIVQAMIEIQQDLERSSELPFFLRFNDATLATVADNHQLAVPTNFIRDADEDFHILTAEGASRSLVRDKKGYLVIRYQNLDEDDPGIETGLPQKFALVNRVWFFYPKPDAIYSLETVYYKKDLELSTNIENLWLRELPFILIARAGLMLAAGLRDKEGLASFGAMNDIMTAKLHLMTTADDASGGRPIMGGED